VSIIKDVRTNGTVGGGGVTANTWLPRVLNTINNYGHIKVELSSNRISFPESGIYYIHSSSPFLRTVSFQTRFRDVTENQTLLLGTSEYNNTTIGTQTRSFLYGIFNPLDTSEYEIQYFVTNLFNSRDLGVESSFGVDEVYTQLYIYKLK